MQGHLAGVLQHAIDKQAAGVDRVRRRRAEAGTQAQRLQCQPVAHLGQRGRCPGRELFEPRSKFLRRNDLILVRLPRVEREQPPLLRLEGLAGQRAPHQFPHRHLRLERGAQRDQVALGVDLARQPGDLGAVGLEENHRRITLHPEAGSDLLRAGLVTVDVDRNERAGALDEVRTREQGGFHLVARRAPHGAPVQEHRLAGNASRGEGTVHLGVGSGGVPGNASWRRCGGRRAGGRRACQCQHCRQRAAPDRDRRSHAITH